MRVGVVGLGYWGPNLVRNLGHLPECTGVVVFDIDPARSAAVGAANPGVSVAESFDSLIGDRLVSAVILATPVFTHAQLAESIIMSGKSVLVEKPLATSVTEARHLVELASTRGVLVSAGHTFLYSPAVQKIRELIVHEEIGELLYAQSSRVNLGIHQSDVSVLWDLAPHDLSILLEWTQETPCRVSACGRSTITGQPPDVAFIDLEFASGFVANVHLSWLAPTKVRRITLVGDRRMVVYEDTNLEEPIKIYDKGIALAPVESFAQHNLTYRTGDVVSPRIDTWEPLRAELQHFLQRVANHETPSAWEAAALSVVEVIQAAESSLNSGGTPIELEPNPHQGN
ncbi:MAG TPA: Gfo/Idh/MocA family oxidoreductase [Acidimicrobiales bacterium]|nr:Gfo/Idh/MocA family oxidoreductase [Acidimicrobiales bacterium]